MGTPTENKAIVQKHLGDRKERRKNALNEARQEAITKHMFSIVNKNAAEAEAKKQRDLAERKERLRANKKIAELNKYGNAVLNRLYLSPALVILAGFFYVVGLTQLQSLMVCVVLAIAYFAFNTYILVQNAGKIAELT